MISVIISADFLIMENLVQECTGYIISNLTDVVRLPIDMSCMNECIIWRIAEKCPINHLLQVYDKRDKLRSTLFKYKLTQMLKLKTEVINQYS